MKVKELIEKLKEFDPELTVTYSDSEDGEQVVTDAWVNDDAWVSWDKATVVHLSGDFIYKEHIDPAYFREQERPVYKPSPMMGNLKVILDDQLTKGTIFFTSLDKVTPNKDGFVEYKIIKGDKNGND